MTTPRKPRPKDATEARSRRGKVHKDSEGFTDKERLLVLHFMGAGNRSITESSILAGYGNGNRRQAQKYGSEVMARPHVIAEIERLTELRNAKLRITADDILRDLVILRSDAEFLPKSVQTIKARREILKDLGDHVAVGAFRRNVGLSAPNGGPIETVDLAALADLSDEELEKIAVAREILDRIAVKPRGVADDGADQGGEGAPPEGE